MTKKTRTRLASKTVSENPRAPRARIAEGDTDKLSARAAGAPKRDFRDVYGIHLPQICAQGRAGPLRVSEIIAAVRYLHAVSVPPTFAPAAGASVTHCPPEGGTRPPLGGHAAGDAVHSSDDTTDADRLLIVLDGLPRLLSALSGVHEYIWAGATIDDAIAAATQYFQTRFKDTDIRAELNRLEDTLNDMVDRLAAMRVTVFGE